MVPDTNVNGNSCDSAPISEYVNHVGISTITLNGLSAIEVSELVGYSIHTVMIESRDITNKVPIVNILISPIFYEALLHLGLGKSTLALINLVDQSDWLNSSESLANWRIEAPGNCSQEDLELSVMQIDKGFSSMMIGAEFIEDFAWALF
ncbi:hypothetical protein M5K25_004466 [Dendrobium thyrsiflorum]|uniref:Uncharacterized protein n=1 Tax=Dendrobium thyrsiflorum TaxID=117978 RepID=A0ABD0VM32_DENTH